MRSVRSHPGPSIPLGCIFLSAAALAAPIGSFTADWNDTHVFNPNWTPHAKFHNAQTISLAVTAASLTLWEAWRPGPRTRDRLRATTIYASLFLITQIPAPFFPGAKVVDPDNPTQPTTRWGIPVNQVTGAVVIISMLLAAYVFDDRRSRPRSQAR